MRSYEVCKSEKQNNVRISANFFIREACHAEHECAKRDNACTHFAAAKTPRRYTSPFRGRLKTGCVSLGAPSLIQSSYKRGRGGAQLRQKTTHKMTWKRRNPLPLYYRLQAQGVKTSPEWIHTWCPC